MLFNQKSFFFLETLIKQKKNKQAFFTIAIEVMRNLYLQ